MSDKGDTPGAPIRGSAGPASEGTQESKERLSHRLVEHSWWKLAVTIVGVLAGVAGIASAIQAIWLSDPSGSGGGGATATTGASPGPSSNRDGSSPSDSSPSTTLTDPSSPESATSVPVRAMAVGDCLGEDQHTVPCTAVHQFEVVAIDTPDCNAGVAMPYLAGNPDLDVVQARFVLDAGTACLVGNATDTDRSSSVKGILAISAGAAGDSFRLCRDDRSSPTDVGCDVPHTGELVGSPAGTVPDQSGCEAAASSYLNLTFNDVSDRLKVTVLPTSNPTDGLPHCVIAVRGNEVLTTSIRNVRTNALPLAAG
jgi:hypothetical protein